MSFPFSRRCSLPVRLAALTCLALQAAAGFTFRDDSAFRAGDAVKKVNALTIDVLLSAPDEVLG